MPNKGLDEFLGDDAPEPDAAPAEPVAETPAAETPPAELVEEPIVAPTEPAPAPEPDPPEDVKGLRSAVVAERRQKQDYKGERDRLAGENEVLRRQVADAEKARQTVPVAPVAPVAPARPEPRQLPPPPDRRVDPEGYEAWKQTNDMHERMNVSEIALRRSTRNDEDVNAKIAAFQEAAAADPILGQIVVRHPDPYRFAYEEGARITAQRAEQARKDAMLQEVGDIEAFKAKIIADERAKWEAEQANAPMASVGQPTPRLPQSLSGARNAAPRLGPVAEMTEFEDMFGPRRKRA